MQFTSSIFSIYSMGKDLRGNYMYRGYIPTLSKKINAYFSMIDAHHNFDLEPEFEIALCRILKDVLGDRFGVCRGYIVT